MFSFTEAVFDGGQVIASGILWVVEAVVSPTASVQASSALSLGGCNNCCGNPYQEWGPRGSCATVKHQMHAPGWLIERA